jgi:glycosyltransferase involved in cell wall biosynthesis
MPLVSVIIPNFNHAKYLRLRLNSIFQQTYNDLEIICLDDASTDESLEIIESFQREHNFTIIKNIQNSGNPFKQWNKGIAVAKGEYIWIAESDDFADPHMLENLILILDNHQNVGLAYCQSYYIDEDDEILGTHLNDLIRLDEFLWHYDFILDGRKMLETHMSVLNIIPNASGVVFRKEIFLKIGGACEDMSLCGDWLTWCKMLMISDIGFVAAPLNFFRVHNQSLRSSVRQKQLYILECLNVLKLVFSCINVEKQSKRKAFYCLKNSWLSIIINQPRRVTISGSLEIFKQSRVLFGYCKASFLLLSSFISFIPLISKAPIIIRIIKRVLGKFNKRYISSDAT